MDENKKEVILAEYQALRMMERALDDGSIESAKRYSDSAKILRMPDGETFVKQFVEDRWSKDERMHTTELAEDGFNGDFDKAVEYGYQSAIEDLKEEFERWKEILGR